MQIERAETDEKPQRGPGGVTGHVLTPEQRRKGALKAGAKRAEAVKQKDEQRQLAAKVAVMAAQARGLEIGQKIEPPDNLFQVIETLGSLRLATDAHAAKALGIKERTWRGWRNTYPEIKEAWASVKHQEHDELVDKLFRSATGQLAEDEQINIVSTMFLLKARHGYRDQGNDAGGGVTRIGTMNNVQIVLPGAQGRDEYLRRVTSPTLAQLAAASEGDAE